MFSIILTSMMTYTLCAEAKRARTFVQLRKVPLLKISGWLVQCITWLSVTILVFTFFAEEFAVGDFLMDLLNIIAIIMNVN